MPLINSASLCLLLGLVFTTTAHTQHLFGNPSCSDWYPLSSVEKTTWLKAYLVPLNMTNVARIKPKVDAFSQLPSLEPALVHVDLFCTSHPDQYAASGAIQFLDALTSQRQSQ